MKKKSVEEFLEECNLKHNHKYDYSKVEYISGVKKICIICPIHGEFWQAPNDHLNGCGCPKCKNVHKYTNEEWIEQARKVHGNKYDYSKVEYINNKTKVCIICPEHGEFWQRPNDHLTGYGCPKCTKYSNKYTTETWIQKAKQIHGDKYDYSKVKYVNSHTKVCIICPEHGEFWQTPNNHLCGKTICPKCSKIYPHSRLENEISEYLLNTYPNFNVTREKKFEWLKNINYLPLDFFIEGTNIAIEVQGKQHFSPIPRFGGEEGFKERVLLDNLKKKLCEENNIKLLYVSSKKCVINEFKNKLKELINEATNKENHKEEKEGGDEAEENCRKETKTETNNY